ncbi:hypothetical protein [Streptomyces bohaiensis]|uniref:Integral membrane protein n=1 Tax=Streptomyces bohaiensis TaxID=1431344 RepID=A0ABX1C7Q9_9ACTN|nr:hypothetical protein [Streptomyces bohaiensis]NJQ14118.1 hypothetical protein [Streptomyces bohaiensis]
MTDPRAVDWVASALGGVVLVVAVRLVATVDRVDALVRAGTGGAAWAAPWLAAWAPDMPTWTDAAAVLGTLDHPGAGWVATRGLVLGVLFALGCRLALRYLLPTPRQGAWAAVACWAAVAPASVLSTVAVVVMAAPPGSDLTSAVALESGAAVVLPTALALPVAVLVALTAWAGRTVIDRSAPDHDTVPEGDAPDAAADTAPGPPVETTPAVAPPAGTTPAGMTARPSVRARRPAVGAATVTLAVVAGVGGAAEAEPPWLSRDATGPWWLVGRFLVPTSWSIGRFVPDDPGLLDRLADLVGAVLYILLFALLLRQMLTRITERTPQALAVTGVWVSVAAGSVAHVAGALALHATFVDGSVFDGGALAAWCFQAVTAFSAGLAVWGAVAGCVAWGVLRRAGDGAGEPAPTDGGHGPDDGPEDDELVLTGR